MITSHVIAHGQNIFLSSVIAYETKHKLLFHGQLPMEQKTKTQLFHKQSPMKHINNSFIGNCLLTKTCKLVFHGNLPMKRRQLFLSKANSYEATLIIISQVIASEKKRE